MIWQVVRIWSLSTKLRLLLHNSDREAVRLLKLSPHEQRRKTNLVCLLWLFLLNRATSFPRGHEDCVPGRKGACYGMDMADEVLREVCFYCFYCLYLYADEDACFLLLLLALLRIIGSDRIKDCWLGGLDPPSYPRMEGSAEPTILGRVTRALG